MQTKTFSRISWLVVLVVSAFVLARAWKTSIKAVPAPAPQELFAINEEKTLAIDIKAPLAEIRAEVASTSIARAMGLSGRASLAEGSGMLFAFSSPGTYGFWMRDMGFPIDMVWIDDHKRVVGVSEGISPETYPEVFSPPSPISYVLELNTGDARRTGIATGTQLVF